MKLDRRTFLKGTAAAVLVTASAALVGCSSDSGENLGGFSVTVGKWDASQKNPSINSTTPWEGEVEVSLRVTNLDKEEIRLPGDLLFSLTIDGSELEIQSGTAEKDSLLNSGSKTLVLEGRKSKSGKLVFKMNAAQKTLYQKLENGTATMKLEVGTRKNQTYIAQMGGSFTKEEA